MADPDVSIVEASAGQTPPPNRKKVRLACQRCRDRRIKCDGQTPSCSKCAKAGVRCIDVDARRAGVAVPRAFLADAQARLEWLEDIVRTRLPDVDLNATPQVFGGAAEPADHQAAQSPRDAITQPDSNNESGRREKRSSDQAGNYSGFSVSKRARRMAADLGMFSLNPNGTQAQYLGSSSGSFFADLLVDTNPEYMSDPDTDDLVDLTEDTRSARQGVRSLLKLLKDILPPREDCNRMVKGFFSFYHADYPLLHQPSFYSLVDALYASAAAPSDSHLQHNGWPAEVVVFRYNDEIVYIAGQQEAIAIHVETAVTHLFFVLSIAAELQTRKRRFALDPKPFATQAMAHFRRSVAEVSLCSIQSMMLYAVKTFLSTEGSRIWIILHVATAYAVDIGLQRDRSEAARYSPILLQMRRRVFLTVYTLERYISTIQGRPLGFEDHTLDLTMPAALPEPSDSEPTRLDQLFLPCSIAHFKWASIISKSKQRFYRLLPGDQSETIIQELQEQLQKELESWLEESLVVVESLPACHQERFKTKLKIDFHFAVGILYQPSRSCPRPNSRALSLCFESAKQRIRLFDSLYCQNNLALTWLSTHGIFLAGATFVYSIWASPEIRSSVSPVEVAGDLRICSSLLALGGEWWPLAQRGKRSFERLADSTLSALLSGGTNFSAVPREDCPPTSNSANVSIEDSQWSEVEAMLQPYFQNDFQFLDFGAFDTTMLDPAGLYPEDPNCPSTVMGLWG